jgi:cardiolipin synthase
MPANLDTFITLIALFLAIWSGIHVILNKREPRGAALWLVIIVFIPIAGPFLYWVLGINRIKRKSRFRTSSRRYSGFGGFAPELIYELSSVDPDVRPLGHLSAKTTQRPLLKGNWIEPLY